MASGAVRALAAMTRTSIKAAAWRMVCLCVAGVVDVKKMSGHRTFLKLSRRTLRQKHAPTPANGSRKMRLVSVTLVILKLEATKGAHGERGVQTIRGTLKSCGRRRPLFQDFFFLFNRRETTSPNQILLLVCILTSQPAFGLCFKARQQPGPAAGSGATRPGRRRAPRRWTRAAP